MANQYQIWLSFNLHTSYHGSVQQSSWNLAPQLSDRCILGNSWHLYHIFEVFQRFQSTSVEFFYPKNKIQESNTKVPLLLVNKKSIVLTYLMMGTRQRTFLIFIGGIQKFFGHFDPLHSHILLKYKYSVLICLVLQLLGARTVFK